VVLRWSPSNDDVGVAGYEAFRGDSLVSGAIDTRASESGLRAGTKYWHAVFVRENDRSSYAFHPSYGSGRVCRRC